MTRGSLGLLPVRCTLGGMRTVKNLSARPLRITLPGGKTLHLGPGKSATIRNEATDHPALKRLCDGGLVEVGAVTPGGFSDSSMAGGSNVNGVSGSRR